MSFPKILGLLSIALVASLIFFNWPKSSNSKNTSEIIVPEVASVPVETEDLLLGETEENPPPIENHVAAALSPLRPHSNDADLPKEIDRMSQLFQPYPPLLPIVETVTYSSKVSWLTGRPAYLGDYAAHYRTSKHFIARSLKGIGNYLSESVSKGDRFNVFRKDKEIEFHLVLDLSRLKLWTYYYDKGADERVLLKVYPVCVGRLDSKRLSGSLTPTGVYALAQEFTIYKPGTLGSWRNEQKEMISVFGVRWLPLQREIANCTGSCRGLGLHGVPWKKNSEAGDYVESRDCIGRYESGGCIRLLTEDIEELCAVVSTKPAYIHIVKDFQDAKVPGKEKF